MEKINKLGRRDGQLWNIDMLKEYVFNKCQWFSKPIKVLKLNIGIFPPNNLKIRNTLKT